ncbi:metallophosphoesterase [Microbacterium sp. NPDC087665]|uniref:metallophosphoesterase n=1 Tax=Microbacterium sp. NPDC087665 TaxID=3364194 RepID=UPI00380C0031
MKAREHTDRIVLPDERVAVCGDWHGNQGWARIVARALPHLAPDVTTMLHLGDWWMPPDAFDEIFAETALTRFYLTVGNHEDFGRLSPLFDKYPGEAVRVSEIVWLLPRPARLSIGGRNVLSLGGASSVDRESRTEGVTWWPEEAVSDESVAAAIAGGPADLMLTHESPAGTPVRAVREILRSNPHWFTKAALEASAASRARVGQVWDAVRPELLAHGHMHVAAGGRTEDGRRVASLGREGHEGNVTILDMRTLRMTTPSLATLRGYANDDDGSRRARELRANSVAESLYTGVLDGLKPTPRALRDAQDYIDGLRSLEEILEDVRRRHTRKPDENS